LPPSKKDGRRYRRFSHRTSAAYGNPPTLTVIAFAISGSERANGLCHHRGELHYVNGCDDGSSYRIEDVRLGRPSQTNGHHLRPDWVRIAIGRHSKPQNILPNHHHHLI